MRFASALLVCSLFALPAAAAPMDCSKGPIWNGPAQGFLNGAPFKVEAVLRDMTRKRQEARTTFNDYHVYLTSKAGQSFDFIAITPDGIQPDGRTFTIGLHGAGSEAGPGERSLQAWTLADKPKNFKLLYFSASDATMQVVFGKRHGGIVPTQIHFCVPSRRTEIAGNFDLNLN